MSILFCQRKILYSRQLLINSFMSITASAAFTVEPLTGSNFPRWKNSMELCLAVHQFDYALREDKPVAPAAGVTGYAELKKTYDSMMEI